MPNIAKESFVCEQTEDTPTKISHISQSISLLKESVGLLEQTVSDLVGREPECSEKAKVGQSAGNLKDVLEQIPEYLRDIMKRINHAASRLKDNLY
uniref:Uncharacterized protein n=1 Tax=viral metagenome TaxID=1070528 RepID=A0A6M3Y1Y8_9ZZZZ